MQLYRITILFHLAAFAWVETCAELKILEDALDFKQAGILSSVLAYQISTITFLSQSPSHLTRLQETRDHLKEVANFPLTNAYMAGRKCKMNIPDSQIAIRKMSVDISVRMKLIL